MIKVNLIENAGQINGLEVSGHANTAEHGKDLLCAAVSAIVTGGFNAFSDEDINQVILEEGYAKIVLNEGKGQEVLHTIIVQLQTIEQSYPKNIKIK